MPPYEAAWKSAEELKIPMLVAGLTIVGAFAPLLLLSGYVGEFISSLPLTVAIAINASFIVAMVLTPYLCYSFIKKGLKSESHTGMKQRLLRGLESWFKQLISFSFNKPKLVYVFAGVSVAFGAVLFFQIKHIMLLYGGSKCA